MSRKTARRPRALAPVPAPAPADPAAPQEVPISVAPVLGTRGEPLVALTVGGVPLGLPIASARGVGVALIGMAGVPGQSSWPAGRPPVRVPEAAIAVAPLPGGAVALILDGTQVALPPDKARVIGEAMIGMAGVAGHEAQLARFLDSGGTPPAALLAILQNVREQ